MTTLYCCAATICLSIRAIHSQPWELWEKNKSRHLHHSPRADGKRRFTCVWIESCNIFILRVFSSPWFKCFLFVYFYLFFVFSIFSSVFIPDLSNNIIKKVHYKYAECNKWQLILIFHFEMMIWNFSDCSKLVHVPLVSHFSLETLFSILRLDLPLC